MSNPEIIFLEKSKDEGTVNTILPSVMYGYSMLMLNIKEY